MTIHLPRLPGIAGAGALAFLLASAGPVAPVRADGPQQEQPSVQSKSSSSSSTSQRATSSRRSSSSSSGSTSSRGSAVRQSPAPTAQSAARDRSDASDWRGYDSYKRRTDHRHHRHHRHYGGSYFYWGPWGYHPWGYYGYGYGYGYGYPRTVRIYDERPGARFGALDLDVSPDDTEVFIDGGYVGTVDEFDGWPTYLWLEEGTYDVVLFREGYETLYRQYTIRPGIVIDVGDSLRPGRSERPEDVMRPDSTYHRDRRMVREAERQEEARREEVLRGPEREDSLGRLSFRIWPADAAVYLDGHFVGTGHELGQLSAGLLVDAGEHELEIIRPGHETWTGDPYVEAGELLEIEVELEQD